MLHVKKDEAELTPISHDPNLKKRLYKRDWTSCVGNISHIVLRPGDTAKNHVHKDGYEIFYVIRGEAVFTVQGNPVTASAGDCLIIEPGDWHAISKIVKETALFYFFAKSIDQQ